jgi:hypothetical protein
MSFEFKVRRFLLGLDYPAAARLPAWMSPLNESLADLGSAELSWK